MAIRRASRTVSKMRIGLFGGSGSGKTKSALRLAHGLCGDLAKVVLIDTENGSADLYSDMGLYSVLSLNAPFSPSKYIDAIRECEREGFEVIIIDSVSHEWEGPGGCLEIHNKLGGKFEHWAKVTPMHNSFIHSIVQSPCHIITTGRSKVDYNFEAKKDGGKGKVEKIGMKAITREGFDYEMTIAFQINQEHHAHVDKDRSGLFKDAIPFLITEETGMMIKSWNDSGAEAPKKIEMDNLSKKIFELMGKLTNKYEDKDKVNALMQEMSISKGSEVVGLKEEQKLEIIAMLEQKVQEEAAHGK